MLGINDRLVIDGGTCSFQARNGEKQTMNGQVAWSRPMAKIDPIIMHILGDYLHAVLDCGIEVERDGSKFKFIFRTQPKFMVRDEPMPFDIVLETVNQKLSGAGLPKVERLPTLLNADGVSMIGWILKALHGKDFTYTPSDANLRWTPPQKKEGYAPLTSPARKPSPLERLVGPVPLKK